MLYEESQCDMLLVYGMFHKCGTPSVVKEIGSSEMIAIFLFDARASKQCYRYAPEWKFKFLCGRQCTDKTMETIESKCSMRQTYNPFFPLGDMHTGKIKEYI